MWLWRTKWTHQNDDCGVSLSHYHGRVVAICGWARKERFLASHLPSPLPFKCERASEQASKHCIVGQTSVKRLLVVNCLTASTMERLLVLKTVLQLMDITDRRGSHFYANKTTIVLGVNGLIWGPKKILTVYWVSFTSTTTTTTTDTITITILLQLVKLNERT